MPFMPMPAHSFRQGVLAISMALSGMTAAQTASPAPATPAPAPAPVASPAKPLTPASAATNRTVSALAINISKTIQGQILSCPKTLKVSPLAVCLYSKSAIATARSGVRGVVGSQAIGDWKTAGQASSLLVQDAPGGNLAAFVLLTPLAAQETLVVVDAAQAKVATTATKPAAPAGVVKGQPYLLDKDLAGVVNVINLGSGKYRLNAAGQTALTITAGSKTAQRPGGSVDLPFAPLSDGKNLLFPLADLRALGCTVTDNPNGVTIACGSDSVGVKPIVF